MKDSVKFGVNRTGAQMSPRLSAEMLAGNDEFLLLPERERSVTPEEIRMSYIRESGDLGTSPMPGSLKGALNTAAQLFKNSNPEGLVDRFSQRLAFERTGVRLYDSLIIKCEATIPKTDFSLLHEFRNDEVEHFTLIRDIMDQLGLDPTAQSPAADVSGMTASGLIQVLNDPRTSVIQCVEAILVAELADNDSWDLLIRMTQNAGMTEIANKFMHAKTTEDKHLAHMRSWLQELTMRNETVPLQ